MNRVWGVSFEGVRYGMAFDCPGCSLTHVVNVARYPSAPAAFPVWRWNNSMEIPTFEPSLSVTCGPWKDESPAPANYGPDGILRCHSFVREGRIQFLSDCTHALAGQTMELPAVEDGKAWD